MGNPKKKVKSKGFSYTPTQEELENFMNFLENLQKEIFSSAVPKSAVQKNQSSTKTKSKKKIQKKKGSDSRIQELPF